MLTVCHKLCSIIVINQLLLLGQLSNCVFLKIIFELIEHNGDDDDLVLTAIRFLLALNLRFDYPHENPLMLTLVAVNEQISCRELIERLMLLFNRSGKNDDDRLLINSLRFFVFHISRSDRMQNNQFCCQVLR